jgi:hypothetical protein
MGSVTPSRASCSSGCVHRRSSPRAGSAIGKLVTSLVEGPICLRPSQRLPDPSPSFPGSGRLC